MTRNGTHPHRRQDEPRPSSAEAFSKLYARPLPYALEAEMSLLGSIILDPGALDLVQPILTAGEGAFYDEAHAAIYLAVVDSYDRVPGADLNTIIEVLRDHGQEEQVGGVDYLTKLVTETPSSAGAPRYAKIIADKHLCRQLIDACDSTIHDTLNTSSLEDAAELLDKAEARVFGLRGDGAGTNAPTSLADLLDQELARMQSENGTAPGLMTGFTDLDRLMAGLHGEEMIVVAARPSMGKTALMLNIAEQVCRGGVTPEQPTGSVAPVGLFSLEMSKSQLVQRLLSAHSQVNSSRIRDGSLSTTDMAHCLASSTALQELPILIHDSPNQTLLSLRAAARRMVAQHGVRLLMIDYLQLLTAPEASKRDGRQIEVSAISRGIKGLAKELQIPIVVLSQLNRASEHREGNRPRMSDLRESGSIEQDADVILLLHREDYYHQGDEAWRDANPGRVNVAEVIIAKQRSGPTGTVTLGWDPRTTRFRNHAAYGGPIGGEPARGQGSLIDRGAGW